MKYGDRSATSFVPHFSDLFADVQKFRAASVKVKACGPRGGANEEIINMAADMNVGKLQTEDYDYILFDSDTGFGIQGRKNMQVHPKWDEVGSSTTGGME